MLSKKPSLPRIPTCRSLVVPDWDRDSSMYDNNEQVISDVPVSAFPSPSKIVFGFTVEDEKQTISDGYSVGVAYDKESPAGSCISPPSVLQSSAALSANGNQQNVTRFTRSGLRNLFACEGENDEKFGLMIPVREKSEAFIRDLDSSLSSGTDTTMHAFGPMEADRLPSCKQRGLFVDIKEDVPQDADIFPCGTRKLVPPVEGLKVNLVNDDTSDSVVGEMNYKRCLITSDTLIGDKIAWPVSKDGSTHDTVSPIITHNKDFLNTFCNIGLTQASGCRNGGCPRPYNASPNKRMYRQSNMDAKSGSACSIFSASDPIPHHIHLKSSPAFLEQCCFCGRSLHLGKDVYMYRGDQSFCSVECRYQRISFDARKAKWGRICVI
ncbi:hypothetical protein KP509_02G110900 [Ceratopteris richardii]|uniref:FLZ-type domain-containing protein n=1 Tax=Ceratopteris richardii TaxID=49495 RepID=A0A8T2V9Q1_CERRI|nr:hypothetical protein KP509_02G110900 [Ceratopteris richardii]